MTKLLTLNNHRAWEHDENDPSGYFHTYDNLALNSNDQPRKVHVFLPRGYSDNNRHYPVVYMNDGNTTFWPNGDNSPYSWEVRKTLDQLYQKSDIRSVIVVAVHPLDRAYEYLHVKEIEDPSRLLNDPSRLFIDPSRLLNDPLKLFNLLDSSLRKGGGLPEYSEYLVRVKAFVDSTYRTLSNSEDTTIIGSSHGGLAAFYTGCVHSEYFGNVGALSPSFWVGLIAPPARTSLQQSTLLTMLAPYLQQTNKHHPKIWIDWGLERSGGYHNSLIEAQAAEKSEEMIHLLVQEYGYTLEKDLFKYVDEIGGHNEQAWAYRFGLILKQYYPYDDRP